MIDFDPDFAAPFDYARLYRELGWQVVPACMPTADGIWKRPAIKWKHLTHSLDSEQAFIDKFYGHEGGNVGIITGECSSNLFVVDLDEQRHISATKWWEGILAECNDGQEFDTPAQRTGGGGRQIFFRMPEGRQMPTGKSPIGVDIRGQGGFVMAPPSLHSSGARYDWLPDYEPWALEVMEAPEALIAAALAILEAAEPASGSQTGSEPAVHTETPANARSLAGELLDGREEYMTQMVWARVVDLYRESPVLPADLSTRLRDAFDNYCRNVKSRIHEPGTPNHILLEREGRGITAFSQKWNYAIGQWGTKIAQAASTPSPSHKSGGSLISAAVKAVTTASGARVDPTTGEVIDDGFTTSRDVYAALSEAEIDAMPDPEWVIQGLIIERGLGFIYGRPGSGKSFVALDIALRSAHRLPDWFGREIVRNGPVVYLSCEGTGDMKFRIAAWRVDKGVERSDQFYLVHESINFMTEADVAKVLRTIQSVAERAGAHPALVFVDTVSRVLPGADENKQQDMTLFVRACDAIREAFHCAVVGVHHTSREGNLRGSTVFDGAGDFLLAVEREEDARTGVLHATKVKAAADGWRLGYELRLSPTGDLRGTESLVVHPVEIEAPTGTTAVPADRRILNEALAAMQAAWDAGNPWSTSSQTRLQGRYVLDRLKPFGLDRNAAEAMVARMISSGLVVEEMADKRTRRMGLRVVKPTNEPQGFG